VNKDMGTRNTKQTSRPVAKKAAALLRDGRTSAKTKSVAISIYMNKSAGLKKCPAL